MLLSLSYNLRYLIRRRVTSVLTLCGVALVVVVYSATLMLSRGLEATLAATGSSQNILVLRNGAENEIQSSVSREEAKIILANPAVARSENNTPIASTDSTVLLSLPKKSDGQRSNVNVRGVLPEFQRLRPGFKLLEGRQPERGTQELMIGVAVYRRFEGTNIGSYLRLSGTDWKVVGIFDAGDTAFSSEIWGDVDIMMPIFKRDRFSSVLFRLADNADLKTLKNELENDRRLSVSVYNERTFYESQSEILAKFIRFLGTFISIVFSLAAIIGCMITMYAAVAQRVREIGILRAIGFKPRQILLSFIAECLALALGGGFLGLLITGLLAGRAFSTTNFQTFADLTFRFAITPEIVLKSLFFTIIMGLAGAILPAWKASSLKVVQSLREI